MKWCKIISTLILNWKVFFFLVYIIIFYTYIIIFDPGFPTSSRFHSTYNPERPSIPRDMIFNLLMVIGMPLGILLSMTHYGKETRKRYWGIWDKLHDLYDHIKYNPVQAQPNTHKDNTPKSTNIYKEYTEAKTYHKDEDTSHINLAYIKESLIDFGKDLRMYLIKCNIKTTQYDYYLSTFKKLKTFVLNQIPDDGKRRSIREQFREITQAALDLENTDSRIMSNTLYVIMSIGIFVGLIGAVPFFLSIGSWVYGTIASLCLIVVYIGMLNSASPYQNCKSIFSTHDENTKFEKRLRRKLLLFD